MSIKVYQYPKCSTCRKAIKWLEANNIAYESINIVDQPPTRSALEDMWQKSGQPLRKLFNTSGQSYRQGNFKERLGSMTETEALTALSEDGKLIKRPLVDAGPKVLVGFNEDNYQDSLGD
ncbi:MAG: hypothetical protein CMH54_05170 [Myxococcales bacterium]|nr:hypothetical protein [Myxococcales bacterium]|tara:strand:+ start:986 stop:1345 length:360 start_codon:yes stop_codon:yes gene_type:complete